MGNFILFSDDYIPVQTSKALYTAIQHDGGKGKFYFLGADVNCLFYKPVDALATPDPVECFHSLANYATMSGRRFDVGYASASEAFCEVLESRKNGLNGAWFNLPGESSKDAFMRRLKKNDPCYSIFESYAAEYEEKWAGAQALSIEDAL